MSGFRIHIVDNHGKTSSFFVKDYDSFVINDDQVEIAVEGVILNKKKLLQNSGFSDFTDFFLDLYQKVNVNSINELDGEFRGYIWDKLGHKLFVFTNPTSTQSVFYTKHDQQIFIDSSLVRLTKTLKENKISVTPDIQNIYKLLTFGNMLENDTPVENIFKILDGHFIEVDLNNLAIVEKKYFDLEGIDYYKSSRENAIHNLDSIFSDNILMEYEKDNELNSKHFALLSGGLDSRIALLYANQLGEKPDEAFCFSQSGYLDETISRQIAKDNDIPYTFQSLDGGSYLNYIDQLTELSQGCGLFTGGIHIQYAFENLENKDFKIIHSGSIGDGILGGFNTVPYKQKPGEFKIVINGKFAEGKKNSK